MINTYVYNIYYYIRLVGENRRSVGGGGGLFQMYSTNGMRPTLCRRPPLTASATVREPFGGDAINVVRAG